VKTSPHSFTKSGFSATSAERISTEECMKAANSFQLWSILRSLDKGRVNSGSYSWEGDSLLDWELPNKTGHDEA
jgi:hypothetical protein